MDARRMKIKIRLAVHMGDRELLLRHLRAERLDVLVVEVLEDEPADQTRLPDGGLPDDKYIQTLGTKVSKKELTVPHVDGEAVKVDMTIWDIMGQKGFRELLKEAYFY